MIKYNDMCLSRQTPNISKVIGSVQLTIFLKIIFFSNLNKFRQHRYIKTRTNEYIKKDIVH